MNRDMTEGPMVSVVIPAYNAERYIREAIDSVMNQTYKNYEVIVIDDGSTDGTREVLETQYPLVRYCYQEKGGAARARNTGIRAAGGDLIAFLDADDIWLPAKLEKQVAYLGRHPEVHFVFTENALFKRDRVIWNHFNKRRRLMQGDIVKNIFMRSGVATPTVMVKKHVFEEVGLFDEDLITAEDDNMWLRVALRFTVALLDESLTLVRLNEGSLTRNPGNLYKGIHMHFRLLRTRYPDLEKRLGKCINKKHSQLHRDMGYYYFGENDFKKAIPELRQSLRHWRFNLSALTLMCLSYLPLHVIEMMRGVKKKLPQCSR